MQVKDLVKQLLEHYPPNAEVRLFMQEINHDSGKVDRIMKGKLTEILYDESKNTIELVAD